MLLKEVEIGSRVHWATVGLLANRGRQQRLAEIQTVQSTASTPPVEPVAETAPVLPEPKSCPYCKEGFLIWTRTVPRPRRKPVILADTS